MRPLMLNTKGDDMEPQKNLGRIKQRAPKYVDPSMPVWVQVVIGFTLGLVVGYCWAYNALQGGC